MKYDNVSVQLCPARVCVTVFSSTTELGRVISAD